MISKTKIKTLEPCPLCGSEVKARELYRGFPPEENPYDDKIWLFQARFKAQCENCFCTQDVAQNFPVEDEKHGKAAVKEFFLEREQFWNRRNKNDRLQDSPSKMQ